MKPIDFIILYLAAGAPFGVLHYFELRASEDFKNLFLRAILAAVFWLPLSLNFFRKKLLLNLRQSTDQNESQAIEDSNERKINKIQKAIERKLKINDPNISIYEFREAADRYIGLTIANQNVNNITSDCDLGNEIFNISRTGDSFLSNVCLQRRNRARLSFHQINARNEFLTYLDTNFVDSDEFADLAELFAELALILNDEAVDEVRNLQHFSEAEQNMVEVSVTGMESEIWKTERQKQSTAEQISA